MLRGVHELVVYLSPAAHSAGSVWSRPRDVHRTVLLSASPCPRPGAGRWPGPSVPLARLPSRSSGARAASSA